MIPDEVIAHQIITLGRPFKKAPELYTPFAIIVHESQRTYRYVPLAKQTLEKLVQGVKKILLNKDLENSISIGNLKNYNIRDVIQTQNFISPINTISELSTAYELLSQRDTSNVNVTHENQNPIYDNDDVCSEISTPEILSDASVVSESF
ncbi:hypothetical protein A3Q56_05557 [Intoshia linei]|uniref:Uncharacterized protein n=1 Tax=Intoshia linei TaxID=1819745 RepID=A0A177AXE8_9BILA|nr:hypothetical protein A3Q56_05557 [Intoshia linei]